MLRVASPIFSCPCLLNHTASPWTPHTHSVTEGFPCSLCLHLVLHKKPLGATRGTTKLQLPPLQHTMPPAASCGRQQQQSLRAGPLLVVALVAVNLSTAPLLVTAKSLPRSRWVAASSNGGSLHDSRASSNARAVAVGARCGATSSGKEDEGEDTAEVCVCNTQPMLVLTGMGRTTRNKEGNGGQFDSKVGLGRWEFT